MIARKTIPHKIELRNVLPELKLEPKFTKSVGFLLRTDFQYTETENAKTEKVKPKKLNKLQKFIFTLFFSVSLFNNRKKLKSVPISVLVGRWNLVISLGYID